MKIMIAALVLAVTLTAIAQDELGITAEGAVVIKGQVYKQTVDKTTSSKQPSWDPLKGNCPMDPSKAIQLASAKLKTNIPNSAHLQLTMVSLSRVPNVKDKWFYVVGFLEKSGADESDSADIIVCLDGTVPPFIKEKM